MAPAIYNPDTIATVAKAHEALVGESAMMLIGSMAFIMCIFYFTNCRSKLISSTMWSMVNLAVSIFCAVLWYDGFGKLIDVWFLFEDTDDTSAIPDSRRVFSRFVQLVAWWFFMLLIFFICRNSVLKLKAYGTVGGHILGFAAIYFFGDIALSSWFRTSPWKILLVILLWKVSFVIIFGSSAVVKALIAKCSDDEDGIEKWHDQAKDTSTDFASMGLSFLIVFFFRFLLNNEQGVWTPPSIDGEMASDNRKAWILISLGIGVLFITALVAVGHNKCPSTLMDYVTTTISTTAAFLLIFGFMQKFGQIGHSALVGQVMVAVVLSIIAVFLVLFVAGLKALEFHVKALRAVTVAVSLSVGLAWEKVFDAAMDATSDYVTDDALSEEVGKRQVLWVQIFFTYAYLLVVFPAWMMYILPKTDESIQKAMKKTLSEGPLPARACFCDADLYDDYEDELYDGIDSDLE